LHLYVPSSNSLPSSSHVFAGSFSVTIHQALFIAPCSHTFHYKCIRPLLESHHPAFSCPLCRTFADLEEDVEVEIELEAEMDEGEEENTPEGDAQAEGDAQGELATNVGAFMNIGPSLGPSPEFTANPDPPRTLDSLST
jgi:hypothetical protein